MSREGSDDMKMLTDVRILSSSQRALSRIDLPSEGNIPLVMTEVRVLSSSQRAVSVVGGAGGEKKMDRVPISSHQVM
jgi:hypothetical protein